MNVKWAAIPALRHVLIQMGHIDVNADLTIYLLLMEGLVNVSQELPQENLCPPLPLSDIDNCETEAIPTLRLSDMCNTYRSYLLMQTN